MTGQGGLLDPSRDFYLIKERLWDWGSGDIYDERGTTIGIPEHLFVASGLRISRLRDEDWVRGEGGGGGGQRFAQQKGENPAGRRWTELRNP